ncbi:MAG: flgG 2 [Proteobacteria bacterium]|jgi:flagellar basal-body rod protein FlgF|nr:flgG 2 [Pseudomonadota bacterium]
MQNATLVALSGQVALRRKLDVIANNVANMDTAGFKRVSLDFEETTMPKASATLFQRRDRDNRFVRELSTVHDFSAGSVEMTGNDLDVAIEGENGFFVVNTPAGERYTRAGDFAIDNTGRLVTSDGKPVLGDGGEIVFGSEETNISFAHDGTVSSSAGLKGKLRIADFPDTSVLSKQGDNLYSASAAPQVPTYIRVRQGALEKSNVSGVQELTAMMDVQRAYERITNMVKQQNDLSSKAIERLGSVNA